MATPRPRPKSVLKSIEKTLDGLGLKMGDVVKMQVFLVGDPAKGGKMDFAGFMEGYTQFFGTAGAAQPAVALGGAGRRPGQSRLSG